MKETLENIQQNLDKESSDDQVLDGTAQDDGVVEDDGFVDEDSTDGEDITQNVDPDALGEDIKESSTEDPSLQEETMGEAVEGEDGEQLMKKQESLKLQRTEPLLTEQPRMIWL